MRCLLYMITGWLSLGMVSIAWLWRRYQKAPVLYGESESTHPPRDP